MTETSMDLCELLQKHDQGDFLRAVAEAVLQLIMDADVEGLIGAGKHERADQRTTWRNGYRERALDTRLGTLNLRVPKLRQGSYFPGFLEPRKTSEKALVAVIQEAWIGGVSTRRVDELAQAMGLQGISKSTVSKLRKDIDERVNEFLNRPLAGEWPYVWLDAAYLKVRRGGRIVSVAAIIAVAADTDGRREIIGLGAWAVRSGNLLDGFPSMMRFGRPVDADEPASLMFHKPHPPCGRAAAMPAGPCTGARRRKLPTGHPWRPPVGAHAPRCSKHRGRSVAPGELARSEQPSGARLGSR